MGADPDQLAEGAALVSTDGASDGASGDEIGARLSVVPLDPLEPHAATAIVAKSASNAIAAFMKRPPRGWGSTFRVPAAPSPSRGHALA